MIHAYDKIYLDKARNSLGRMLDYAVYDLEYNLTDFWNLFINSDISTNFEQGDINTLVGRSGIELCFETLSRSGIVYNQVQARFTANRSEEYWAGWALAYYQWETSLPFNEITRYIPISEVLALYTPYHEMDIHQFIDRMNKDIRAIKPETNLKLYRKRAGLSQSGLALASGVPLRTIQQYEQRQKNINKAQADYLIMLASALSCNPSALIERI